MLRWLALAAILALPARPATKLLVTVIEQKSGKPVTDLKAGDFSVLDDRTPRRVEAAEFSQGMMDLMLLLDTSLLGEMVQPLADNMIEQLQPKEQMAIVSFHSSADLVQDFTSSRELLHRSIAGIKYGNSPKVLDALYAAIDGGYQGSSFRRVLVLLTTGVESAYRSIRRFEDWERISAVDLWLLMTAFVMFAAPAATFTRARVIAESGCAGVPEPVSSRHSISHS